MARRTGLEPEKIFRACSVSSLGTPFMLDDCHAKISLFSWRKSKSVSTYFGSRLVPMEVVLAASLATSSNYLVFDCMLKPWRGGINFLLGVDLIELFAKIRTLRKSGFSILALLSLCEAAFAGYYVISSHHLQLVVAWSSMEGMERRSAKYDMVGSYLSHRPPCERNYLKADGFLMVVILVTDHHVKVDVAQ
jgi:hypothetical protein